MLTTDGVSIRKGADYGKSKFSGPMAEYLYARMSESDQYAGASEGPWGWFERFGKRVLRGTSQGFVFVEEYPSAQDAEQAVDAWSALHNTWEYGPFDDETEIHLNAVEMSRIERWAEYVDHCSREGLVAFDFRGWRVQGEPRGPITTMGEATDR